MVHIIIFINIENNMVFLVRKAEVITGNALWDCVDDSSWLSTGNAGWTCEDYTSYAEDGLLTEGD